MAGSWWICTDALARGGAKVLGPFGSQELALRVRWYIEAVPQLQRSDHEVRACTRLWVDDDTDTDSGGAVIDAAYIRRLRDWADRTFRPDRSVDSIFDHLVKEIAEAAEHPEDPIEWADIIMLAIHGALLAGHKPQAIIDAVVEKQAINEARTWPNWRTQPVDRAIEHVRDLPHPPARSGRPWRGA